MAFSSRVSNQSVISYPESTGLLLDKASFDVRHDRKKKRDGRLSTKEWVLRSFHSKSKSFDGKSATSAPTTMEDPKPAPAEPSPAAACKVEPAVYFRQSLIDLHGERFKFCLVGKFPAASRPSLARIRDWVEREWRLTGECPVTLLDPSHVLLRLDNQDDMLYIWARQNWTVDGCLMKILKWTPGFRPSDGEPPLAAVWVVLPRLPLVFFSEELLLSIASQLGKFLLMDGSTKKLTKTNVARVCVEIDLSKEIPRRIWIGTGDGGFWQKVRYEKLPSYCSLCGVHGHAASTCKVNTGRDVQGKEKTSNSILSSAAASKSRRREAQVQFSIAEPDEIRIEKVSSVSALSQSCAPSEATGKEEKEKEMEMEMSGGECSYVVINKQGGELPCTEKGVVELAQVEAEKKLVEDKSVLKEERDDDDEEGKKAVLKKDGEGEMHDDGVRPLIVSKNNENTTLQVGDDHRGIRIKALEGLFKLEGQEDDLMPIVRKSSEDSMGKRSPSSSSRRSSSGKRAFLFWERKSKRAQATDSPPVSPRQLVLTEYRFSDIEKMTNSFSTLLGRGGFGTVFKGELPEGRRVAVKVTRFCSMIAEEEYANEVTIIKRTNHANIVKLLGYSLEGCNGALVYEFMPNGSLDKFIYSQPKSLDSQTLIQIAIGVARGLEYLHQGFNIPIVHFDIKPNNILLDENFNPRIGDFGLAKPWNLSSSTTSRVRGTKGYVAPELLHGKFSDKLDVYSYGVMLLEMVVRRKPIDTKADYITGRYLLEWVYRNINQEAETGLGRIAGFAEEEIERKMIIVGLWCVQAMPVDRPSITKVVQMLQGNICDLQLPPNPFSSGFFQDIETRKDVADDTE